PAALLFHVLLGLICHCPLAMAPLVLVWSRLFYLCLVPMACARIFVVRWIFVHPCRIVRSCRFYRPVFLQTSIADCFLLCRIYPLSGPLCFLVVCAPVPFVLANPWQFQDYAAPLYHPGVL